MKLMNLALGLSLGLGISLLADEAPTSTTKDAQKHDAASGQASGKRMHKPAAAKGSTSKGNVKPKTTDQKNISDGAAKGQANE